MALSNQVSGTATLSNIVPFVRYQSDHVTQFGFIKYEYHIHLLGGGEEDIKKLTLMSKITHLQILAIRLDYALFLVIHTSTCSFGL